MSGKSNLRQLPPSENLARATVSGQHVQRLGWRWIFWVLTIVCAANTLAGFFFLRETYAPVLLAWRKQRKEQEEDSIYQSLQTDIIKQVMRRLAASPAP